MDDAVNILFSSNKFALFHAGSVPLCCSVIAGESNTSVILSHSESARTPVTVICRPEVPNRSMLSKSSVSPELVHLMISSPSTETSKVTCLSLPLYIADGCVGEKLGVAWRSGGSYALECFRRLRLIMANISCPDETLLQDPLIAGLGKIVKMGGAGNVLVEHHIVVLPSP